MLENILGWYSFLWLAIVLGMNIFSEKKPIERFTGTILNVPILIYIIMVMFCQ